MTRPPTTGPLIDASDDSTQTLQNFTLAELQKFTKEQAYSSNASNDFHLFFVGRDDVHDILAYVLSRVRVSLYLNMFGYDDEELNKIIMKKVMDPSVTVIITLDKSQSGGAHEKALLDADRTQALAAFNTHFTIGQSLTHQISHTKGFVADGKVGAEGSTNWSTSGEGTFVVKGQPGGTGYKAQSGSIHPTNCRTGGVAHARPNTRHRPPLVRSRYTGACSAHAPRSTLRRYENSGLGSGSVRAKCARTPPAAAATV
jgi:hypothetical protein